MVAPGLPRPTEGQIKHQQMKFANEIPGGMHAQNMK